MDTIDTSNETGPSFSGAPDESPVPASVAESDTGSTPPRRSVITTLATGAARRWRVTAAFFLVVLLAGGYSFAYGLDREGFPPINTPISVVSGTYFVDDAERVDEEVVAPLVDAFVAVDGVVEVTSEARESSFGVTVEFEDSINSDDGTERLLAVDVDIPSEANIAYNAINAAKFVGQYDSLVSVVGPDGATNEQFQEQAELLAGYLRQDSEIAVADVRDLITEQVNPQTGEEEARLTRFTRVALGEGGYRDAAAVGIIRPETSDLDVLDFNDRVSELLDDGSLPLSEGFDAEITADFANGVRQQLSSLTTNLLTGLVAVSVVSLLLIGWRVALITALFMGTVVLGSLVGLLSIGYTLNTITLFGLIISLGLLVDDAIVISESIDANKDEPDPSEEVESVGVIRRAIDRVGTASFAGTLTTVVVFSPMLFVGGILGEFIRPIPATVIVTLLLSFLFSIVFIPAVARALVLRSKSAPNPIVRAEKSAARAVGRLAGYPAGNGWSGRAAGFGLAAVALVAVMAGGSIAGTLGFSIFPSGSDSVGLSVGAEFDNGTTIEEADAIARDIDSVVTDVLGAELDTAQYVRGNERLIETFIDLTPIDSRSITAPEFVEEIETRVAGIAGARVTVSQLENGPPVLEFPFAAQIDVTDDTLAAGQQFAEDLRDDLIGQEILVGGETVTVIDAVVSTDGVIGRIDGDQYLEVRAKYDTEDGLTGVLNETETYVNGAFPTSDIEQRGLAADALTFDFGLESDNQDDFAALGIAGLVALLLMLVLITVQFRSLAQSLLIFLAIPFGFFGVTVALSATGNPLSFLSTVGFIALIGVAVNNTILLVDAANQERRAGATAGEAISSAVESRFRPLVATTITTVAGLLPLSLSDPFWESLGFTLMGGLLSSTFLVLLSFPAFYLGLEAVRTPVRNVVRRARNKPEVA
ncbi:MAG: efflux RND transporter permease subunit [Ilumatobacter sp.]